MWLVEAESHQHHDVRTADACDRPQRLVRGPGFGEQLGALRSGDEHADAGTHHGQGVNDDHAEAAPASWWLSWPWERCSSFLGRCAAVCRAGFDDRSLPLSAADAAVLRALAIELDETQRRGSSDRLDPRLDAELPIELACMRLDGPRRDPETTPDLVRCEALGEQARGSRCSRGVIGPCIADAACARRANLRSSSTADSSRSGGSTRSPRCHASEHLRQIVQPVGFTEEREHTAAHGLQHEWAIRPVGQHDDARILVGAKGTEGRELGCSRFEVDDDDRGRSRREHVGEIAVLHHHDVPHLRDGACGEPDHTLDHRLARDDEEVDRRRHAVRLVEGGAWTVRRSPASTTRRSAMRSGSPPPSSARRVSQARS